MEFPGPSVPVMLRENPSPNFTPDVVQGPYLPDKLETQLSPIFGPGLKFTYTGGRDQTPTLPTQGSSGHILHTQGVPGPRFT